MASYYTSGRSPFGGRPGPQNRGVFGGGNYTGYPGSAYGGLRGQIPRIAPQTLANQYLGRSAYTAPDQGQQPAAAAPQRAPFDPSSVDYSNDPILARVRALSQQNVQAAEADALAQKEQLAIGYGDPEFAKSMGLGETYAGAASANPFGTVQELARTYKRRDVFDINRPLSDTRNLFYSSERGRQLALSGEQNLRDKATASRAVQDRLASIQQAVVQAKLQAQAQQLAAEQQAYQNAVQNALYNYYNS